MRMTAHAATCEPSCDVSFDALFTACTRVGRALAMKVRRPPKAGRRAPIAAGLDAIAAASDMHVREVMLPRGWWTSDWGPFVGTDREDGSPVAVIPRALGGHWLLREGRRKVAASSRTAGALGASAYVFHHRLPDTPVSGKQLLARALAFNKVDVLVVALTTMAIAVLSALVPIALGLVVDVMIPGGDRWLLAQVALLLLAASAALVALTIVHQTATRRLEGRTEAWLQAAVWDRVLRLPHAFFWHYTSGDIAQRISALTRCQQGLTAAVFAGARSGAMFLVSGLLLIGYGGVMGLVAIALGAGTGVGAWLFGRAQIQAEKAVATKTGELFGLSVQVIGGVFRLRALGAEPRAVRVWSEEMAAKIALTSRSRQIANRLSVFVAVFVPASVGVILAQHQGIFGGRTGDTMTLGGVVAFLAVFVQFIVSTLTGVITIAIGASALPLYERLRPILSAHAEPGSLGRERLALRGSIDVKGIMFRYRPDGPPALMDVTFTLAPGESLGVVGPSGSGKSTLLRVLLGLAVPYAGEVAYDGVRMPDLDVRAFRRSVGVVLQTTELIPGTIASIVRGAMRLAEEEVWAALRAAALDEDVARMPLGVRTHVGHGGMALSEGQRQRLLIASAIARRPALLLLDEATSALDDVTQEAIRSNLDAMGITRVVVAHRLGALRHCGRIIALDRGRIVEDGSYSELCSLNGLFRRLARGQTGERA